MNFARFSRVASSTARRMAPMKVASGVAAAGVAAYSTQTAFAAEEKPQVLFVLGPPGAGKGTNCTKLVETMDYFHISAGDCLREERNNPNSKDGELINSYIKDGKIVPVEITIKLMLAKMAQQQSLGKTKFLVDGFPRNENNKQGWEQVVGDKVDLLGVLFYDTDEATVTARIMERGKTSGRVDDNAASMVKRLKTYQNETYPIIMSFKQDGVPVYAIDASPSMEVVWESTKAAVTKAEGQGFPTQMVMGLGAVAVVAVAGAGLWMNNRPAEKK